VRGIGIYDCTTFVHKTQNLCNGNGTYELEIFVAKQKLLPLKIKKELFEKELLCKHGRPKFHLDP